MAELKRLVRPKPANVIRADQPEDYTGPTAQNRSLYINLGVIRFGTNDKLQGAAIFLSLVLLLFLGFALAVGLWHPDWSQSAISTIATPLMLVIGVAVGRSNGKDKEE